MSRLRPGWAEGDGYVNDNGDYSFQWHYLGDIELGRPNLGNQVNVAVYRLMQYTLRDAIARRYSPEVANELLREAGRVAGMEFCRNMLDRSLPFNGFVADLQDKLQSLKMGILRIEQSDQNRMKLVLTISEDLDCSGLPVTDVTVCEYDEGFLAGIFAAYTGREFAVKEVDCWATGDRTCRFTADAS